MTTFLVLLSVVLGALWRRWLGGWLGGARWWRFAAIPLLALPAWLTMPWWLAILLTGAAGAFFAFGHNIDGWNAVKRYGPFGIGYPLAYWAWRNRWNQGSFIDGATAIGELFLGGSFWATATAIFLAFG